MPRPGLCGHLDSASPCYLPTPLLCTSHSGLCFPASRAVSSAIASTSPQVTVPSTGGFFGVSQFTQGHGPWSAGLAPWCCSLRPRQKSEERPHPTGLRAPDSAPGRLLLRCVSVSGHHCPSAGPAGEVPLWAPSSSLSPRARSVSSQNSGLTVVKDQASDTN